MVDADDIVLEAVLDDVLDDSVLTDAANETLAVLAGDTVTSDLERFERELAERNGSARTLSLRLPPAGNCPR
jgi:hypothetical protein